MLDNPRQNFTDSPRSVNFVDLVLGDEAATAVACDLCHERRGVNFVDQFWACGSCAVRYLQLLEWERRRLVKKP